MMKLKKYRKAMTLIEAMFTISIFAAIVVVTGTALFSTIRSGAKLTDRANVLQAADWAIDSMINEARWGVDFEVGPVPFDDEDVVIFESDSVCVWYWRGFDDGWDYGNNTTLYRGIDSGCHVSTVQSLRNASGVKQTVTEFIIDNPDDPDNPGSPYPIFEHDDTNQSLSIVFTVAYSGSVNNQSQTLRVKVTALND